MKTNVWSLFQDKVIALTTTRDGGISPAPYRSLNLAFHTKDEAKNVIENRQRLLAHIHLPKERLVLTHQSHSDVITKVTVKDLGKGSDRFESGVPADALYTYEKNLAIGVFHADCVPVFLYDPVRSLVAIIHAGTEGTLKKITEKSVQYLVKHEGIQSKNLYAYLGPALDFAHHPIDETSKQKILALDERFALGIKLIAGQYYLDVPLLNIIQLTGQGIPFSHIENCNIDTFSNPESYYSYRKEPITGRHISLIALK